MSESSTYSFIAIPDAEGVLVSVRPDAIDAIIDLFAPAERPVGDPKPSAGPARSRVILTSGMSFTSTVPRARIVEIVEEAEGEAGA